MRVRRSAVLLTLGLGLALGPAAAASASGDYPPTPSGTTTPSVLPSTVQPTSTPTETEDEGAVGITLPRTGGEVAVVALAGAALLGAGGVAVATTRRRGARA
jgi:LPXTG-motif cell wall-anchored protein